MNKSRDTSQPRYLYKSNFSENRTKHLKKLPNVLKVLNKYKVPSSVKMDDLQARLPKSTLIDVNKYHRFQLNKSNLRQHYETVDSTSPSLRRKYCGKLMNHSSIMESKNLLYTSHLPI